MPQLGRYLAGFNLQKRNEIGNYEITNISGAHLGIIKYHKYKYPITITFKKINNKVSDISPGRLLEEFKKMVKTKKVIKTRYGNPYECDFGNPKIVSSGDGTVVIKSTGECNRIKQ